MRERRKIRNIPSGSGANSGGKVTWPFFKFLLFLDRTLEAKRTSGNVPDNETFGPSTEDFKESQNSQYESQQEFIEDNQLNSEQQNQNNVPVPSQEPKIKNKRKIDKRSSDNDIDRQYLKHLKTVSERAEEDKDPDLLFLRSLLPSMKKLGPMENLEFKGEVINLLKNKIHAGYTGTYSNPPSMATSFSSYSHSISNVSSPDNFFDIGGERASGSYTVQDL